jgi:hypothetical protein
VIFKEALGVIDPAMANTAQHFQPAFLETAGD